MTPEQMRHYHVNHDTGFVPTEPPLSRLPSKYDVWEDLLAAATDEVGLGDDESHFGADRRQSSSEWRRRVRKVGFLEYCNHYEDLNVNCQQMRLLDISDLLRDIRLTRRAHVVLTWIMHFYMHSQPKSPGQTIAVVPRSISEPLVAISRHLGIAPVLTYADTVLWNWKLQNKHRPISIHNLVPLQQFTSIEDEWGFYLCSLRVELQGAEILRLISEYEGLPLSRDRITEERVARILRRVKDILDELIAILVHVRNEVDPNLFYHLVRPWYNGSGSVEWEFEGFEDEKFDLSGPSGGQSSLVHALDVFLQIDHSGERPFDSNPRPTGFMARMRRYMPREHRYFLEALGSTRRPIRDLVARSSGLQKPFSAVVDALKKFRDQHIKIASAYILSPGRGSEPRCPMMRSRGVGTGGNEVLELLNHGIEVTKGARFP